MGMFLFFLNILVGILGWLKVGKLFMVYSILSVVFIIVFMGILLEISLLYDILLNVVFGGVIFVVGIGLILKYGVLIGGFDIVVMVLVKWKDKFVGIYFFIFNGIIILMVGLL